MRVLQASCSNVTVLSHSKSSVDATVSFEAVPKDSEERVDNEDEIEAEDDLNNFGDC